MGQFAVIRLVHLSPDPEDPGAARRTVPEGSGRHPLAELETVAVPVQETAAGAFGHDQVGRSQLPEGQQPAHQRVDAGVRRVRDDPERMTRPAEGRHIHLQHGDARVLEASA
jgi:hypothetical protein